MNTPVAINELIDLVGLCNVYLKEKQGAKQPIHLNSMEETAKYITRMLRVFGVMPTSEEIGFPSKSSASGATVFSIFMRNTYFFTFNEIFEPCFL
jgi:cysteinyl-tRNA synthetase